MNNRIKRLRRDIEGLGFTYDDDASSQRRQMHAYRHANDPDQILRVSEHMSDSGCTAVWKKAQQIAGLSTTGTSASSIKERARIKREAEKRQREEQARARDARAAAAERRGRSWDQVEQAERARQSIESLMQNNYGH